MCRGGCGTELNGRRRRCPECKLKQRAAAEKRRYHLDRDQDVTDYERADELPPVDYSQGGDPQPGMRPIDPYRNNPRHDTARRVQDDRARQMAESGEDLDADQVTWDQIAGRADDHSKVSFPAAPGSPALGGGFRGRGEAPEISDWASAGELYRPSAAA